MKILAIGGICFAIFLGAAAEKSLAPFDAVHPVLEAMRAELPPALNNPGEASWNSWSRRQDTEIRTRLEQGEVDSMINLLLFGTSFTKRPRIQFESLAEASKSGLLRSRVDDLLQGLRTPGENERLVFLRSVIRRQGLDPDSDDGKTGLFVFQNLQRVLQENAKFGQRIAPDSRDQAAPFRELVTRAVEVRPAVVLASEPVDLNIVLERINLPATERFDLIIATNVFVYYGPLEQSLALQNVSTLLKPGGILLSNDELQEIPGVPMRRLGATDVFYTDKLGTSVTWYRRQ